MHHRCQHSVPRFVSGSCVAKPNPRLELTWLRSLWCCAAASPLVLPAWGVPTLDVLVSTATTGTDVRLVATIDGSSPSCESTPAGARAAVARSMTVSLAYSGVVTVKAVACRSGVLRSPVTETEVFVAGTCHGVRTRPVVVGLSCGSCPSQRFTFARQLRSRACTEWAYDCET